MAGDDLAPFDLALLAWADTERPQSLASIVEMASQRYERALTITFETVFAESGSPLDVMFTLGVHVAQRLRAAGVELLRMEDDDGSWVLAAFSTPHEGVFHIASGLPTTHPRWRRVDRWIDAARGLSRCFLNHRDFESVGDHLAEFGDVEVSHMSARVVSDFSSLNRGFRQGMPRPNHLDAIQEAERHPASIRSLALHVERDLSLHLRRTAGATYYSGRFDIFEKVVLSRLGTASAERRILMTNRQRRPRTIVRPVKIRLERPVLSTPDDTATVMAEIQHISNTSIAVFHGNPYLHVAVTDEIDGSNFDIMVTQADAIDIYPGYRATMGSLTRLAQQLGERFGASEIAEPEPESRTSLTDLALVEE